MVVLKPRVSKALKTPLSSCLFLEMGSMLSIEPKNRGKGDDLFLLNLLTTCLNVSKYPASHDRLHPPQRLVKGSITEMGSANFLKNRSWK